MQALRLILRVGSLTASQSKAVFTCQEASDFRYLKSKMMGGNSQTTTGSGLPGHRALSKAELPPVYPTNSPSSAMITMRSMAIIGTPLQLIQRDIIVAIGDWWVQAGRRETVAIDPSDGPLRESQCQNGGCQRSPATRAIHAKRSWERGGSL